MLVSLGDRRRHVGKYLNCVAEYCLITQTDVADSKDGHSEIKGGADEEKGSGVKSRSVDVNKGQAKSATTKKSVEVEKNKVAHVFWCWLAFVNT